MVIKRLTIAQLSEYLTFSPWLSTFFYSAVIKSSSLKREHIQRGEEFDYEKENTDWTRPEESSGRSRVGSTQNRRNRIGQKVVERLVYIHTNLKLEQCLEMYEDGLFPWDIEMTVEEPVSDDDDGPPHRVSDSESEFESEEDSD